ncbi:hypothetical protein KAM380_095510 [Aeromonas caviae]|nr:hypothetical protein KAM380_095510 [Aeromonas caviae]
MLLYSPHLVVFLAKPRLAVAVLLAMLGSARTRGNLLLNSPHLVVFLVKPRLAVAVLLAMLGSAGRCT